MGRSSASGARRRTPTRARRRRRRLRGWLLGAAVLAALAYGLTRGVENLSPADSCAFAGPPGAPYRLDPAQAQNASIIAAVGARLGMPDHAVTVALATALQESHLRNLTYGDLDSLGLFQQRPTEGWGSRAQVLDPVYAAGAFYRHLARVPGWQTLAVPLAAQAVQNSADGEAYGRWEGEARRLAIDLTGEAPAGLACRLRDFAGPAPARVALEAEAQSEMAADPLQADPGPQTGWRYATWLVAHAYQYHLGVVRYANRQWTAKSGQWRSHPWPDSASVVLGP